MARNKKTHTRTPHLLHFGLTIPLPPGVLAAVGPKGEGGSGDVQVLDQMTEPVHDPVGHLSALPQKLMQRHECRLWESHTHWDVLSPSQQGEERRSPRSL